MAEKKAKKEIEVEVTEKTFNEKVVKQSEKVPVVADFFAEWCMPCVMLGPVLEKVVKDYKGKVILAKINIEENKKLAKEYKIMSIPSVKLFKKGEIIDSFMGNLPEAAIKEFIEKNL